MCANLFVQALAEELESQKRGPPVDFSDGMINIIDKLEQLFADAIKKSFPDLQPIPAAAVTISQNEKNGDYQCNNAMAISGVCTCLV